MAQTLNALALAFNKSGGSFQSNIDGSLAVRLIQGFVSQGGIICAQLAQIGFTGPKNFLEGIYGYFHLYAKDHYDPQMVTGALGEKFEMTKTIFKRYPSCGGTLASTDAILDLVQEKNISPEDVARIDIKVAPGIYNLVGHQFEIGDNPRVNAQFNIQYCVANALLRKSPKLHHFEESFVRDPKIKELTKKIHVSADPALNRRSRTAVDIRLKIRQGTIHNKSLDIPHGFPGDPLTDEEHKERFEDCVNYAGKPLPRENIDKIISSVNTLEQLEDVRVLIPLVLSHD
jgi:2-methylcitrate dehydratase PrpD